ncbi:hypothetical protein, partial [Bacillus sp. FJAT-27445]|uniref:hypothetical protein n=1 Tax=Bacillus sp. FJAT-27445 TaxID=1679166 RepID=UPI001C12C626
MASLKSVSTIQHVAFRKSLNYEADHYALAAWLTHVEKLAREIETTPFRKRNLEKGLPDIRQL